MSNFQQAIIGTTFVDGGVWSLIDGAIKVSVILLGTAMIAWILRKSSAAVRHLAWTVSMIAVLLVPILSMALPPMHVLPNVVTNSLRDHDSSALLLTPELELFPTEDAVDSTEQGTISAPTRQSATKATISAAIFSLRPIVLGLWFLGAAIMLLRTFLSFCVLHRLANGGHSIADSKIEETVLEVRRRLGLNADVQVFLTDRRSIPMTWGIFNTHLLLPAEAVHWAPDRIRAVLLHELGHAKRRDMLSHLIAQMVTTVFWFHPLVWIAVHRMNIERERACDDLVIATGIQPSAYAEHLVAVIARLQNHSPVPSSALAMAMPSMLEGRVLAILNDGISRQPMTRSSSICCLLIGLSITAMISPLRAQVATNDKSAPESSSDDRESSAQVESSNLSQQTGQISTAVKEIGSAAAEEAASKLRELGAVIRTNDDGKVIEVQLGWNCRATNDDLVHLADLAWDYESSDSTLVLKSQLVTDEGLTHLRNLTNLQTLRCGPNFTDEGLRHLSVLTGLSFLNVDGEITGEGFKHLATLTKLTFLWIHNTSVTDSGLGIIVDSHPEIRTLVLPPSITDEGLVHLKRLPKLSTLHMRNVSGITDQGLEHLRSHHSIRKLIIGSGKITNEGLRHLKDLRELEMLATWGRNITDDGLIHLAGMASLNRLYLNGARIEGRGLRHLRECPLVQLELNDVGISDSGLTQLETMDGLRFLSLAGSPVTDAGLESLSHFIDLETLNLGGTKVTKQGVSKIQDLLPGCRVAAN